jgi:hypothetical protein
VVERNGWVISGGNPKGEAGSSTRPCPGCDGFDQCAANAYLACRTVNEHADEQRARVLRIVLASKASRQTDPLIVALRDERCTIAAHRCAEGPFAPDVVRKTLLMSKGRAERHRRFSERAEPERSQSWPFVCTYPADMRHHHHGASA